VTYNTVGKL